MAMEAAAVAEAEDVSALAAAEDVSALVAVVIASASAVPPPAAASASVAAVVATAAVAMTGSQVTGLALHALQMCLLRKRLASDAVSPGPLVVAVIATTVAMAGTIPAAVDVNTTAATMTTIMRMAMPTTTMDTMVTTGMGTIVVVVVVAAAGAIVAASIGTEVAAAGRPPISGARVTTPRWTWRRSRLSSRSARSCGGSMTMTRRMRCATASQKSMASPCTIASRSGLSAAAQAVAVPAGARAKVMIDRPSGAAVVGPAAAASTTTSATLTTSHPWTWVQWRQCCPSGAASASGGCGTRRTRCASGSRRSMASP